MIQIVLAQPRVVGRNICFSWTVDPAVDVYRATEFTLRFPDEIDVAKVPARIWWLVFFLCLHTHWAVIRPCRVSLPVRIGEAEREFWLRLIDAHVATLEAMRGTTRLQREVEIADGDLELPPIQRAADSGRCAAAFSGGKDSLAQAGLLCELTQRPILVTTTSPLFDQFSDHISDRRRQVLREIPRRRDVTLIEVRSDIRSTWHNFAAAERGYLLAISELTDALLYFACTMVAGVALGAPHLFLASEAEVQFNTQRGDDVVQMSHFMYSTITQRAVSALLERHGLSYGSLTAPLHNSQVQRLLWTRYRDISDLQYSCWRVAPGESACSACSQCLRITMGALEAGGDPAAMGIDLAKVLRETRTWAPKPAAAENALPGDAVTAELSSQLVYNIRAVSPATIRKRLVGRGLSRFFRPDPTEALRDFDDLRARLADFPATNAPRYWPGFVETIDPLLRDRVAAIFAASFEPEAESRYAAMLRRNDALVERITAPMRAHV